MVNSYNLRSEYDFAHVIHGVRRSKLQKIDQIKILNDIPRPIPPRAVELAGSRCLPQVSRHGPAMGKDPRADETCRIVSAHSGQL